MKLRLVVQYDADSHRWSAAFPEIPGCATAGDTEQEAVANAKEALALWFEPRDLELEEGARILEVAIP
jgi:predicted RNase H-like HicB family nuclease